MKEPRVLYLFPSSRDTLIQRVRTGQDANTLLWGMNHMPGAEQMTTPILLHTLFLLPRFFRYDFIIAQDDFSLGYIVSVFARIFRRRTRWIYIAMTSSTLMRRHAAHPVRLFFLREFWMSYYRIVCLSSAQLEDFVRFGIARKQLVFMPLGVDTTFFKPTNVTKEEALIVSVGRDAGRDYATLLQAAAHVNVPFVLVAAPRNIPDGLKIPKNVSILYNRTAAEIRDLYARASLVTVVSKDESVPDGSDCSGQIVILDALASGKAVIATRRSWMKDYFVSGEDLMLVEPNDPEALARAITGLLTDTRKRESLSFSGHSKVASRHTTEAFAAGLRTLL